MKTCVIIPAFDVASHIAAVIHGCKKHVTDIIVIDDGSRDGTGRASRAAGAQVMTHPKNLGKGAALKTGFLSAQEQAYEAVITLDGDGQHAPDDIPRLLAAAREDTLVIGSRMHRPHRMPVIIFFSNIILSRFISLLCRTPIRDTQSGFRLLPTQAACSLACSSRGYEFETEQLIQAARKGFSIVEVPVTTIYNKRTPRRTILRDFFSFLRLFLSPRLYRF